MERTQKEKAKEKEKEKEGVLYPSRRKLVPTIYRSPTTDVRLASISISLNIRLRSADMPAYMQELALRCTRSLVDVAPNNRPNPTHIARALKKEFDSSYGLAWHCVAGTSFGSFVTHSPGGFIYFSLDSLSFLLFKTEVEPVIEPCKCP